MAPPSDTVTPPAGQNSGGSPHGRDVGFAPMAVVGVTWDAWQMECCGTPFRVGARVEWPLHLITAAGARMPAWTETTFTADVSRADGTTGEQAFCLGNGDLRVFCYPDLLGQNPSGRIEVRGLLYEDHHSDSAGVTVRAVRRIQVESFRFEPTSGDPQASKRVPSSYARRAVDVAPKWFQVEDSGRPHETGMRVELEVSTTLPISPIGR